MLKITLFAIVAFLAITSSLISAQDTNANLDGVKELTPDNFDEVVGKDVASLVFFKAPWCGHCKALVPELTKLGKAVAGNKNIVVAKVDADAHSGLGSRFGVSGFPTIKFFPAGSLTPEDYNGGRDAKAFIKFLNEKANAGLFLPFEHKPAVQIEGLSQYTKVTKDASKKLVFVKNYAPWCGHCKSMAPAWDKLAEIFKNEPTVTIADCDCDAAVNKPVAEAVGVQGFPTIKFYQEGGEAQDYQGGRTLEDLVAFVNEKAGTQRSADGGLSATAGTTPELIELAGQFLSSSDRSDLTSKISAAVNGNANLEWFNKIVASIAAKGESYVETEAARISKMLSGGKVAANKKDSLSMKLNALNAFKKN